MIRPGLLCVFVGVAVTVMLVMPVAAQNDRLPVKNDQLYDPVGSMHATFAYPEVREIQLALEARGYDPRTTDGILWPWTRAAIATFQRDEGLVATGTADGETVARLGLADEVAASPRLTPR